MSWRIVIVTQILPLAQSFRTLVADLGHQPVALLTLVDRENRFPADVNMPLSQISSDLDILVPASA